MLSVRSLSIVHAASGVNMACSVRRPADFKRGIYRGLETGRKSIKFPKQVDFIFNLVAREMGSKTGSLPGKPVELASLM